MVSSREPGPRVRPAGLGDPSGRPASAEPARIVLVEDEDMSAFVLETTFGERGHSVHRVSTLAEARQQLDARPDLVLLDILLPDGNGLDLLQEIRRKLTLDELPVILMSGLDSSEKVVLGLQMGANDYVAKPFDPLVLVARVDTQLALRRLSNLRRSFLRLATAELRAPLTSVQSLLERLSDELGPEAFRQESGRILHQVRSTSRQMLEVVDAFLSVEQLDAGEADLALDRVSLNQVARDVVERRRVQAIRRGVRLDLELRPDLPEVAVDVRRIAQGIRCLVDHAITFSQPGYRVVVRTLIRDGRVGLEVEDQGPMLTSHDLEAAFLEGVTLVGRPTSPSGLGLWVARKLVLLHDGDIGVRNNAQHGVTLWFTLPLEPQAV